MTKNAISGRCQLSIDRVLSDRSEKTRCKPISGLPVGISLSVTSEIASQGLFFKPDTGAALYQPAFENQERGVKVKVNHIPRWMVYFPRYPISPSFIPFAGLEDKAHQVYALEIIVLSSKLFRQLIRTAVPVVTGFHSKHAVFRAEAEMEILRMP